MSYSVDELFKFDKIDDGYFLMEYLKKDDPSITELELPEEYNGIPVTAVGGFGYSTYLKRVVIPPSVRVIALSCFGQCKSLETAELPEGLERISHFAFETTNLKSVVLPKSLIGLGESAFMHCRSLESVTFNSAPIIERNVFDGCPKLPPETVVIGLVRSFDITKPINSSEDFLRMTSNGFSTCLGCFRPDVFELLLKNDSFRLFGMEAVFRKMIDNNKMTLFPLAESYGKLENAELIDELIGYSAENQTTEITAYLLDLKNRKFGFNGGNDYEL